MFQNITFSLCEEVDIFYCLNTHKEVFSCVFNESSMQDKLISLLDTLETRKNDQIWTGAL